MGNDQLRLRYSGFVVFINQLLGVVTGLIFLLLLTRSMTSDQFGIWTNIFDYTPYFLVLSGVLPFWVIRFKARGKIGTVRTGVLGQLVIGVISATIYLPVIYFIANAVGTASYLLIYYITALYLLTYYMVTVLESVLQATKPQTTGYGFMIQEVVKVAVALVLILVFKQLFLGAILALVIAPSVQILYYCFLLRDYFKEPIDWHYLKQWLKGTPVTIFNYVGSLILSFVFILLFLYGGATARGFYGAALSFTTIVSYSQSLSISMYPKLLSNSCSKDQIGLSFKTVLMLAIPLATIIMTMSYSFLTVLKSDITYGFAWPVLIVATIDTLVVLVSNFYFQCIMGVETFDAEGQISFRQMLHSKIFKLFTIPYIQAAIALPLTYFVLTQLPIGGAVNAAVALVVVLLTVHAGAFIGTYYFMRGAVCIPVAWGSIVKFIGAAFVSGIALYFLPTTTTLIYTVVKAMSGFAIYVGVLYAIDAQARELVKLIFQEVSYTLTQFRYPTKNSGQKAL